MAMDIAGDELIPMDQRHMDAIKVLNYNCMTYFAAMALLLLLSCRELSNRDYTLHYMLERQDLRLMSNE